MYENLTPYEKALANFGDSASIIASLEISGKIAPNTAYKKIRKLYNELKELRKLEKKDWGRDK